MVKILFIVTKRANMDWNDFRNYWRGPHAEITKRMPGLRKYVQNHVVNDPSLPRACDGVAELFFDDMQAYRTALETPEGKATRADLARFVDMAKSGDVVVADEVAVI